MSRYRFAVPQTRIPGATRRTDPDTLLPMTGKKRVPLWDMPTPVRYVEHTKRRLHKHTKQVIEEPVMVPIYRGISAALARSMRADYRRTQRKVDEARKHDLAKAAATHEATMKMQDSIMNPGGNNVGE